MFGVALPLSAVRRGLSWAVFVVFWAWACRRCPPLRWAVWRSVAGRGGIFSSFRHWGSYPNSPLLKIFKEVSATPFGEFLKKFLTSGGRCGKMSVKWQKESLIMGRNPYGKNLVFWAIAIAIGVASFVVGVINDNLFSLICGIVCVAIDCGFFGYFVAKYFEWEEFEMACKDFGDYVRSCIVGGSEKEEKAESPFKEFDDESGNKLS